MAKDILIRKVPAEVHEWIEEKRYDHKMTRQDFLCRLLKEASVCAGQEGLFDTSAPMALPMITPSSLPFTFIDIFAGIGGFRLGLQRVGGRCLFSCEWDQHAQKTYRAWYGETPVGDIRDVNPDNIPDHDVLAAGFPCQPFSIAGVSKKNSLGRLHGFKDAAQGTLFFQLATIVEAKRPPVLILENVKNLLSHDSGKTWKVIDGTLRSLGYTVFHKIIDAKWYVPQHRERIFIVCFDRNVFGDDVDFQFPAEPESKPKLKDILEKKPPQKYTLTDHLWSYLQAYAAKHREKGNGFGFGLADTEDVSRTLSARYYKDGSEILIPQGNGINPRRLTPREAARLMGYPDDLEIVVSDTQAYRQFGNAVVPAVVEDVGKQVINTMYRRLLENRNFCLLKGKMEGKELYRPDKELTHDYVVV